jgi:hypothetical protein
VLTSLVLPISAGETPLQQYNSVLAGATMLDSADSVLYTLNEWYSGGLLEINARIAAEKAQLLAQWEHFGLSHFGTLQACVAGDLKFVRLAGKRKGLLSQSLATRGKQELAVVNCGIEDYLQRLLEGAEEKVQAQAYLHWYDEWNAVPRLKEAIERLWAVVWQYQDFSQ